MGTTRRSTSTASVDDDGWKQSAMYIGGLFVTPWWGFAFATTKQCKAQQQKPANKTPQGRKRSFRKRKRPSSVADVLATATVYYINRRRACFLIDTRSLLRGTGVTLGMAPLIYGTRKKRQSQKDDKEKSSSCSKTPTFDANEASKSRGGAEISPAIRTCTLRLLEHEDQRLGEEKEAEDCTSTSQSSSVEGEPHWEIFDIDDIDGQDQSTIVIVGAEDEKKRYNVPNTSADFCVPSSLVQTGRCKKSAAETGTSSTSEHYKDEHDGFDNSTSWLHNQVVGLIGVLLFCMVLCATHHVVLFLDTKDEPSLQDLHHPAGDHPGVSALLGVFAFVS